MMNEKIRSGSCYCGKITVKVYGKPISVSICHCTICQRLNGGPFGIQSLHKPTNFEINIIEDDNNNNNDDDQSQTPTTTPTTTTTTSPSSSSAAAAHHPPLRGGGEQQQDDDNKNEVLLLLQKQKSKSLWSIQTSKNVTRYRCTNCGSPIYATLGKGKTIVVPRTMLFQKQQQQQQQKKKKKNINQVVDNNDYSDDDDEDYRPTHHMHYGSRIIDFNDDLPKYVGSSHPTRGVLYCENNGHDGKKTKKEQQKNAK